MKADIADRLARVIVVLTAGLGAGAVLGAVIGEPLLAMLCGGLLAMLLWALADALRAGRIWKWLAV